VLFATDHHQRACCPTDGGCRQRSPASRRRIDETAVVVGKRHRRSGHWCRTTRGVRRLRSWFNARSRRRQRRIRNWCGISGRPRRDQPAEAEHGDQHCCERAEENRFLCRNSLICNNFPVQRLLPVLATGGQPTQRRRRFGNQGRSRHAALSQADGRFGAVTILHDGNARTTDPHRRSSRILSRLIRGYALRVHWRPIGQPVLSARRGVTPGRGQLAGVRRRPRGQFPRGAAATRGAAAGAQHREAAEARHREAAGAARREVGAARPGAGGAHREAAVAPDRIRPER
jgi:hypothetical protein